MKQQQAADADGPALAGGDKNGGGIQWQGTLSESKNYRSLEREAAKILCGVYKNQ
jgi:hypothetical protein